MKETDYQKIICDVIEDSGGYAKKLSHRFLAGLPDLLVQHPKWRPAMFEVKLSKTQKLVPKRTVFLAVTALQAKELRAYAAAGGSAGVVSIVLLQSGNRTVSVGICIRNIAWFAGNKFPVLIGEHRFAKVTERGNLIWTEFDTYFTKGGDFDG